MGELVQGGIDYKNKPAASFQKGRRDNSSKNANLLLRTGTVKAIQESQTPYYYGVNKIRILQLPGAQIEKLPGPGH